MLISIVLPVIGYQTGKAGDCKPGQIDGQCGLSTFVWFAYGVIGAVVIAVSCTAHLIIALLRQRKASSASRTSASLAEAKEIVTTLSRSFQEPEVEEALFTRQR
jgi:hypothetical protein